jgi:hypothetical protein
MRAAHSECAARAARPADASDNTRRHHARHGHNDCAIGINRKNALFADSDEGGANWTTIASLIETAKLNGVNPHAWLTDTLTKRVNGWPNPALMI